MRYFKILLVVICVCLGNTIYAQTIQFDKLTCEYQENPIGIDVTKPRFTWTMLSDKRNQQQTAYEILVSTSEKDLKKGKGTSWSSGKVTSNQSIQVEYAGQELKSFTKYFWKIRIYDQDGKPSKWSKVNFFETALFHAGDWKGDWIGDGSVTPSKEEDQYKDDPNPLFRKQFGTKGSVASARLYISGLGYYEAYINGDKVGDYVLEPGWTAYDKQVLYSAYDVTAMLRKGENKIGVMLGNGWYNMPPLRFWGAKIWNQYLDSGRPKVKALLRITYKNGQVEDLYTNQDWETSKGPILRNNIYLGEHYDARLENPNWNTLLPDGADWKKAVVVSAPKGVLTAQQQPGIRVTKVLKPVSVKEVEPGVYVFDMGQNFAGVARLKVKGPAGTHVKIRYGEDKYSDGKLNGLTAVAGQIKGGNGGPGAPHIAWQEDSYILKGEGVETWQPRFTFHGFRYVEIKGWPGVPTVDDIEGLRMNADLQKSGMFSSSNDMFNKVNNIIQWTFLSNVFSVVSDCPAREKLAYGGDILCGAETFMFNYDMSQFYSKTIRDHANDQRPLGGITETAPFVGIDDDGPGDRSGPLGYQAGYPYLIKKMYDFYGDKQIIEQYYPSLVKLMEFLNSKTSNYLFSSDLGDHESLEPKNKPLTASVFYWLHAQLMSEFAGILGKENDQQKYLQLAVKIKQAITKEFFNPSTGKIGTGTQSDQLFGLWAGIDDNNPKAYSNLLKAFEAKVWHLSTGIFGTKFLFDVLSKHNDGASAFRIANQDTFPGWGHMVKNGATTLWETWQYSDNTYSQNHPMFGSVGEWFYRGVLGINHIEAGFKKFLIKPQATKDLQHANGTYESIHGTISSSWKKIANDGLELQVKIPVNTSAEIWVPNPGNKVVKESGKTIAEHADLKLKEYKDGFSVFEVGSGIYTFQTN